MPTAPRPNTPQSRSNRRQALPAGGSVNSQLEQTIQGDVQAIETIKKSIMGRPQGPTTRAAASFVDWNKLNEELGQPHDMELIPFSKLRQMRRDPMIAFGLYYIKAMLVRAPWKIVAKDDSGPRPDIAAFVDAAIRPIYARLILQLLSALDFGFAPIAKQFKMEAPSGTYVDVNGNDLPIWSEGSILPVVFKPFKPLPPWESRAAFDEKTGEFNGIIWQGESSGDTQDQTGASGMGASSSGGSGGDEEPTVDVFHSLWATNDRDSVFDSLYGYPRIAHAYRYWWSWQFRWAQADRAFERFAIPPILGYYPEGRFEDDEGLQYDNLDVILDAIEQIRANGGVALPSSLQESSLGERTNLREWALEFLNAPAPQEAFGEVFDYLDVMKLRSTFTPEQAFLEGKGGTSSRNVAGKMQEVTEAGQENLMNELDDQINRFAIPHLLVINFPEFIGSCRKVTTGFAAEDVEFLKQIIQLVGQNPGALATMPVDLDAIFERAGVPLLTPKQVEERQRTLIAQTTTPALGQPAPGQTGAIPNQASATGFSYVSGGHDNLIALSDDASFMSRLPDTPHFEGDDMKRAATRLQAVWARHFARTYSDFAAHVERSGFIGLADDPADRQAARDALIGGLITAAAAKQAADVLVRGWQTSLDAVERVAETTAGLIRRIFRVAATRETGRVGVQAIVPDEERDRWTDERVGHLVATTDETVRREVTAVVADAIERGENPTQIARTLTAHFRDFPQWKSERVARTEAQTAYNTGTIMAARAAGLSQVQAHDASDGTDTSTDEECIERDGNLFEIAAALRENEDEHPNGTLYFTIVPSGEPITIAASDDPDVLACYDAETRTVFLSDAIDPEDRAQYMKALVRDLADG